MESSRLQITLESVCSLSPQYYLALCLQYCCFSLNIFPMNEWMLSPFYSHSWKLRAKWLSHAIQLKERSKTFAHTEIHCPSNYILLCSQSYTFIVYKHGIILLRSQAFVENNNQYFEKIENYFLTEIENAYTVYKRRGLFLTCD